MLDNPPEAGDVYTMHLDSGPALAPRVRFLPALPLPPAPGSATLISELQAIQAAIAMGLARVLIGL